MKTKYWLFAAALSLTACSQQDELVEIPPVVTDSDFESPDGRVVIQLGTSGGVGADVEVMPSSTTRGSFESINDLAKSNFGVYAIHGAPEGWTNGENHLLRNIKATVSSTETVTGGQGGYAETGSQTLNKIHLYDEAGSSPNHVWYYPTSSAKNYSFYAYAPFTGANPGVGSPQFNPYVYYYNYQGNLDIIWAKCTATTVPANTVNIPGTQTKFDKNLEGYNARYLRYLKNYEEERQGTGTYYSWVPNFKFEHKMVRLKFFVVPASAQTETEKADAKKLTISDVKILNHPAALQLDMDKGVVSPDQKNLNVKGAIPMFNITTESSGSLTYTDTKKAGNIQVGDGKTPEGYFMVCPDQTSFEVELTINRPNNKPETKTVVLNHPTSGKFLAGESYDIKLGIYALQTVEATATLTEWKDQGSHELPVE